MALKNRSLTVAARTGAATVRSRKFFRPRGLGSVPARSGGVKICALFWAFLVAVRLTWPL